jgi:hypothetical protein
VLQAEGIVDTDHERFLLDEGIGAIPIRIEQATPPLIWLSTPPFHAGKRYAPALCAKLFGLDVGDLLDAPPQWLRHGNPIAVVAVKDAAAVDRAWLDRAGEQTLQANDGARGDAYGRLFAPLLGARRSSDRQRDGAARDLRDAVWRGLARRALPLRAGHEDGSAPHPSRANQYRRNRIDRCRQRRRADDRSGDGVLKVFAISLQSHSFSLTRAACASTVYLYLSEYRRSPSPC